MNIKCHWCHKDLEAIQDNNDHISQMSATVEGHGLLVLECPDVHAQITLKLEDGKADQIIGYTFYHDVNGKRYKVCGHREMNKTSLFIKDQSQYAPRGRYDNPLNIKRYLAFKPNKETGILEGEAIFKRLKNLIIFS